MPEVLSRVTFFSKKVIACPVCGTSFNREDILTGRGRLIAGELTNELRRQYEPSQKYGELFPLIYTITVCPTCRYSAFPSDFLEVPERAVPPLIDGAEQRQRCLEKILPDLDFFEPRTLREGTAGYYYAIMCYDSFPHEHSPTIKQGLAALRTAWLFHDLHRQSPGENFDYLSLLMYRKARFFYNRALELEKRGEEAIGGLPTLGPDLDKNYGYDGVLYLAAYLELYHGPAEDEERRVKSLESARRTVAKVFGMGKATKDKPSILLDKAKELFEKIGEELKTDDNDGDT